MVDLLLALLATLVILAVGLTALAGLTVVPFLLALRLAETRQLSPGRVGAFAAGGILLGLALSGAALVLDVPVWLVLPALALTYVVPLLLRLLGRPSLAGTAGRHE